MSRFILERLLDIIPAAGKGTIGSIRFISDSLIIITITIVERRIKKGVKRG